MMYYFCIDIPWENTYISVYDTLDDLIQENRDYMKLNDDWYVLKGQEIEVNLWEVVRIFLIFSEVLFLGLKINMILFLILGLIYF